MTTPILYRGISQLATPHPTQDADTSPLPLTHTAALLVADGKVIASGSEHDVNAHPEAPGAEVVDLGGRAVVPGLVDSHTHVVFAGQRMDEMAMRARGDTYESIAQQGGGIVNSVDALQDCPPEELVAQSQKRVEHMRRLGVTTLEIKSGYGLSPELEAKQLDAIQALANSQPITIVGTVLAHVIPRNMRDQREAYIQRFRDTVLPDAVTRPVVRYCDVFVESGAFTPEEATQIAETAAGLGLKLKLHVDQLHDGEGATLAATLGALSADHLEKTNPAGARALAEAGVIATVLPGCGLFLGGDNWPDARALRDAGCSVAIATDCNPGSSMVQDLPLCGTLGATQCGLSLEEALWGITRGGALALGMTDRGTLGEGERADFVVLDSPDWKSLFYSPAATPVFATALGGVLRPNA